MTAEQLAKVFAGESLQEPFQPAPSDVDSRRTDDLDCDHMPDVAEDIILLCPSHEWAYELQKRINAAAHLSDEQRAKVIILGRGRRVPFEPDNEI